MTRRHDLTKKKKNTKTNRFDQRRSKTRPQNQTSKKWVFGVLKTRNFNSKFAICSDSSATYPNHVHPLPNSEISANKMLELSIYHPRPHPLQTMSVNMQIFLQVSLPVLFKNPFLGPFTHQKRLKLTMTTLHKLILHLHLTQV